MAFAQALDLSGPGVRPVGGVGGRTDGMASGPERVELQALPKSSKMADGHHGA